MKENKVHPDLQRERNGASFNTENLTNFIDGGEYITERRREVEKLVFEDPEFRGPPVSFLSRDEEYEEGIRRNIYLMKKQKEHNIVGVGDQYWLKGAAFPNIAVPTSLNEIMFIPTLEGQASDEQKDKWLDKAINHQIIGTYAQTELGHGTFLRGLETTATYDKASQEFVLHSPTTSAIKWWPGGLGKTCNYAVVMANLIIDGKAYGMHGFVTQLRDLQTHEPLPGITVGDIGPKFGFNMIDNGFLKLDHYRIPRTNMLMKYSKVQPDGTYETSGHSKSSYGTMVFVRAMIVWEIAARCLAQASTIAIRYSCVRRQSELKPGGPEPQVLDFQTQQYKLFVPLASSYAFHFAGIDLRNMYFSISGDIAKGKTELLPELHGVSSALKAYTTRESAKMIEACRLACGGHGYSHASGIPKIYTHFVASATYEGEVSVLLLQAARYLIKVYNQASQGLKIGDSVAYLREGTQGRCLINQDCHLDVIVTAFKHRASRLVRKAASNVSLLESKGEPYYKAWNQSAIFLVKAVEAYVECLLVETFHGKTQHEDLEAATQSALTNLAKLYALNLIREHSGDFLEDGYMSVSQLETCEQHLVKLLALIRRDAVAFVDAFDFNDIILDSVLGRYDGQVYENLYKWASASPLNKNQVHPAWHKHVKPNMSKL